MATTLLTPNTANPLTGLSTGVLGWHFTSSTIEDVFTGCTLVYAGGWVANITPPGNQDVFPPLWILQFEKAGVAMVTVNDTDWFTFDGTNVGVIPEATVNASYTQSNYVLPGGS